jgi:hypothetical protein
VHSSSGTRCLIPNIRTRSLTNNRLGGSRGGTDLESRGGFFPVVLGSDTADDEQDAEEEENEELGRDVRLHCLEGLVEGWEVGDELSQRGSWVGTSAR